MRLFFLAHNQGIIKLVVLPPKTFHLRYNVIIKECINPGAFYSAFGGILKSHVQRIQICIWNDRKAIPDRESLVKCNATLDYNRESMRHFNNKTPALILASATLLQNTSWSYCFAFSIRWQTVFSSPINVINGNRGRCRRAQKTWKSIEDASFVDVNKSRFFQVIWMAQRDKRAPRQGHGTRMTIRSVRGICMKMACGVKTNKRIGGGDFCVGVPFTILNFRGRDPPSCFAFSFVADACSARGLLIWNYNVIFSVADEIWRLFLRTHN